MKDKIKAIIKKMYRKYMVNKKMYKFNKFIFDLSLNGLGIYNYESFKVSGEEFIINKIKRRNNNPVIIDIGAFDGKYYRYIKNKLPKAKVLSFEPNPAAFARLLQINQLSFNIALGSSNSEALMFEYEKCKSTEHATLVKNVIEDIHGGKSRQFPVKIMKLDAFLADNNVLKNDVIDLIKIDVEGFELEVLKGATETIKRARYVQFEFNEMNLTQNITINHFINIFGTSNLFRLCPWGFQSIASISNAMKNIYAYQNLIWINENAA